MHVLPPWIICDVHETIMYIFHQVAERQITNIDFVFLKTAKIL